ncbi:MAG: hypothetical protein ACC662_06745 [Planctomycetota bacterium]
MRNLVLFLALLVAAVLLGGCSNRAKPWTHTYAFDSVCTAVSPSAQVPVVVRPTPTP